MGRLILLIICLNAAFGFAQKAVFYCPKKTVKHPRTLEGKTIEWSYSITNKGDLPLIITDCKVECSCTEVDYPRMPIAPGKTEMVRVRFNTKGRPFYQDRIIEFKTNSSRGKENLRFKVYVIPSTEG